MLYVLYNIYDVIYIILYIKYNIYIYKIYNMYIYIYTHTIFYSISGHSPSNCFFVHPFMTWDPHTQKGNGSRRSKPWNHLIFPSKSLWICILKSLVCNMCLY